MTIGLFLLLGIFSLHHLRIIYILPIPKYEKPERVNPLAICNKIRDNEFRRLCFEKVEHNHLKVDLYSLKPFKPCFAKEMVGNPYYTDGDIPYLLKSAKDDSSWCFNNTLGGVYTDECLAFTKNPYYCERVMKGFSERAHCYLDAALVWQDSTLCARAYSSFDRQATREEKASLRDYCLLAVVTKIAEEPRKH